MAVNRGAAIVHIAVTNPVVMRTTKTHPGTSPLSPLCELHNESRSCILPLTPVMRICTSMNRRATNPPMCLNGLWFIISIFTGSLLLAMTSAPCAHKRIVDASPRWEIDLWLAVQILRRQRSSRSKEPQEAKRLRCVSEGQRAKRTEIGRMRNTTGTIMDNSALPALSINILR